MSGLDWSVAISRPEMEGGFLTVDEVQALERLVADARHEATIDERAGRTEWAANRRTWIADVDGILARHRWLVVHRGYRPGEL